MSQHRIQWPSRVIEPGLIEIRDLLLGARHPDHDRRGIRDEAEAFLAFAQGLFGERALDQVRGLPGEHVEESEFLFRRDMRRPPVRREHAERPARSRSQRRGLHGADAGAAIFLLILRAGHELARFDIGHDHALVVTERLAAGAPRSNRHRLPECRRVGVEMSSHARSVNDAWSAASIWTLAASDAISSIAASRICAYRDSGVRLWNQAGADRLERFGVRHLARQLSLALPQRGLSLLDLRDVARNFGASDNPARGIPQRRNRQRDINALGRLW